MNQQEFDLPDPHRRELRFAALRATQPIGDLYIAIMDAKDLELIANFDVRRVLQDERDVERYLGIQRPLNPQRVADLQEYVQFSDATFPTSIIIAIDDNFASFDENEKKLIVRNYKEGEESPSTNIRRIARVIDGQHRIAGLFGFKGHSFQLTVTIFIGSDISDQAYIFATVNLEQTKVSRSLAYDLYSLAKTRSPQRTCHNIAVTLDSDEQGPFYRRIKRLGVATPGRSQEMITQATFVESVLPYISGNPKSDRDRLLNGYSLNKISHNESLRYIFRNMFISGHDLDITEIIFNYFSAIRKRWPEGWDARDRGLILNRTNGFRAFMRVLRPLYISLGNPGDVVSTEKFERSLSSVPVDSSYFNTDNYPPGTSGESALRRDLLGWLALSTA
jgi:DGQHR domain-containing protein